MDFRQLLIDRQAVPTAGQEGGEALIVTSPSCTVKQTQFLQTFREATPVALTLGATLSGYSFQSMTASMGREDIHYGKTTCSVRLGSSVRDLRHVVISAHPWSITRSGASY